MGSAIIFCFIMWGTCKTASDKYSSYHKEQEYEKARAKNPYSERGGKESKHSGCETITAALLCNIKGPRASLRKNLCCCLPEILAEQLLDPSFVSFLILIAIVWSVATTPEKTPVVV